jgi:hypothetical protein
MSIERFVGDLRFHDFLSSLDSFKRNELRFSATYIKSWQDNWIIEDAASCTWDVRGCAYLKVSLECLFERGLDSKHITPCMIRTATYISLRVRSGHLSRFIYRADNRGILMNLTTSAYSKRETPMAHFAWLPRGRYLKYAYSGELRYKVISREHVREFVTHLTIAKRVKFAPSSDEVKAI